MKYVAPPAAANVIRLVVVDAPASSLYAYSVEGLFGQASQTSRIVSIALPAVSNVAAPLAGAVHRYQTETPIPPSSRN